ncbi:hypothetical protein B7494_g5432 [Chlorociboria aeruginascens]|nr:hypothetical protein B7494_g5432 [Chlorociboria aeruginascens]
MAPTVVEEDYYLVLNVSQSDSVEVITKAYKDLALHLHPDKNRSHNATEEFQKLSRAYETLKDEATRRIYDIQDYPRIKRARGQTSRTQPTPNSNDQYHSKLELELEAKCDELVAIHTEMEDRVVKWLKTQKAYQDKICKLKKEGEKLQDSIRLSETIQEAEAAEAAAANSWITWILSPITTKRVETEEEKEQKERERLQRLHAKSINEVLLLHNEVSVQELETLLADKTKEFEAAKAQDGIKLDQCRSIFIKLNEMVTKERNRAFRETSERFWREREAKCRKVAQERQEREEREAERYRRAEEQEAKCRKEAQERQEREEREAERYRRAAEEQREAEAESIALQKMFAEEKAKRDEKYHGEDNMAGYSETGTFIFGSTLPRKKLHCQHDGWWPQIDDTQWTKSCDKCGVSRYTYLLQCPSCRILACASCQQVLRPQRRNINKGFSSGEQ